MSLPGPLRRPVEILASVAYVARAGVLDRPWYERQTGRRFASDSLAAAHYVLRGRRRGLSPHPLFEPEWYAPQAWRDAGADPLAQALRRRRTPSGWHPLLDGDAWAAAHPDAAAHPYGPAAHLAATAEPGTRLPTPEDWPGPDPTWGELRARLLAALDPEPATGDVEEDQALAAASDVVAVVDSGDEWWPTWRCVTALLAADTGRRLDVVVLRTPRARRAVRVLLAALETDPRVRVRTRAPAPDGRVRVDVPVEVEVLEGWDRCLLPVTGGRADSAQPVAVRRDGAVRSAGASRPGAEDRAAVPLFVGLPAEDAHRAGTEVPAAATPGVLVRRPGPGTMPATMPDATSNGGRHVVRTDAVVLDHREDLPPHPAPVRPDPPPGGLRWAVRTAVPAGRRSTAWGDLHFARALAAALERLGQHAVVDPLEAGGGKPTTHLDDVALVLRGVRRLPPVPGAVNVLWVISHPELVADDELADFDVVLAASRTWAEATTARTGVEVLPLLQATDPTRFHPGVAPPGSGDPVLFVGNSRNVARPVVTDLLAAGVDVAVHGSRWERLLPPGVVRSTHVPNDRLPAAYASAGVVLNDHWPDMRAQGFLSNRLFDAAACGARVVTDDVPDVEELFGGLVRTFTDRDGLVRLVTRAAEEFPDDAERARLGVQVGRRHSFDARARILLDAVTARGRLAASPDPDAVPGEHA
ncbi:glycosyltransferase [Kineosporiaceae bacterium SCSIO 59966]|nr:glycosyltransferase [Kineosporiaceae bacterium SCSIO 59966]